VTDDDEIQELEDALYRSENENAVLRKVIKDLKALLEANGIKLEVIP